MESTLGLTFDDIRSRIGDHAGYGTDSDNWSTGKIDKIENALNGGLRRFYHSPIIPTIRRAYRWSFMRPVTTLATVASTADYELPVYFGGMDGPFTYSTNQLYQAIKVCGEGQIRELRASNSTTGVPMLAAIRPKSSTGAASQRMEVMFWPTPDAVYTLSYRYLAAPEAIAADHPYPLGGEQHAETIIESCLAWFEENYEDRQGVHTARFQERLMASFSLDAQATEPDYYGVQMDYSRWPNRRRDTHCLNTITPPTT